MTTDAQIGPAETSVEGLLEMIPYEDDGDNNRLTHIVSPPENLHIFEPGMEAQDIVDIARATHNYVVALCGYKWIPVHNPEKYDACQRCMDIAAAIMRDLGE